MTTPDTAGQRAAQTANGPAARGRRVAVRTAGEPPASGDGVPRIVMAGEVHYFRLHREDWADRLDKLVAAGCTAVATYIPWLVHETARGEIDLDGSTSEYRDMAGFLELAAERGLLVIARPGPFVMAELKNEGMPFRVYRDHPGPARSAGTGSAAPPDGGLPGAGLPRTGRALVRAVMPVLAERLITRGGPVAAVQLDNEVGMLAWITNTPEMTDRTLEGWLRSVERFGREGALTRYGRRPW